MGIYINEGMIDKIKGKFSKNINHLDEIDRDLKRAISDVSKTIGDILESNQVYKRNKSLLNNMSVKENGRPIFVEYSDDIATSKKTVLVEIFRMQPDWQLDDSLSEDKIKEFDDMYSDISIKIENPIKNLVKKYKDTYISLEYIDATELQEVRAVINKDKQ